MKDPRCFEITAMCCKVVRSDAMEQFREKGGIDKGFDKGPRGKRGTSGVWSRNAVPRPVNIDDLNI